MDINYNQNLISANILIIPQKGQVIIAKKIISISPVNMKVLMLLVENHSTVVSRNFLFDKVWGNQIVSDDALTRSISDLRAQLGQGLIKTHPKRGYQWVSKVAPFTKKISYNNKTTIQNLILVVIFAMGLALLTLTSLWVTNQFTQSHRVTIAILPILTKSEQGTENNQHIEQLLKSFIISNKKLSLLSSRVLLDHTNKPFPYLYREYNAQWVIDGHINQQQNTQKATLSLVDARTALVTYSLTSPNLTDPESFVDFCQLFLQNANPYLFY